MRGINRPLVTIGGALLLSMTLISCGSPVNQPISEAQDTPPPISTPIQALPTANTEEKVPPHTEPVSTETNATPAVPVKQLASSTPAVEASTIESNPKKQELPSEVAFDPEAPTLRGIGLGASEKDVFRLFGLPLDTYPLPGGAQTITIWEYYGCSIGLSSKDKVVYVEITSSEISTGIRGLTNGMDGSQAAHLLGIPHDDQSHVLTLEVARGWFRLDLDPETQSILSLKLLSNEI